MTLNRFLPFFTFIIIFQFCNISMSQKDQVIVENSVSFFEDEQNKNLIRFKIKVTNQSRNPIPDLGVENRSKFIKFYFNGKENYPLNLYNDLEKIDGPKTIPSGSSQEFQWHESLVYYLDRNVFLHEDEFTVQWEYRKIKSKILQVNVRNRTVTTLE
ncbi:hypothetical protein LIH_06235 [Leptospira interrogans serovar Hardjo-prajitno]|uniref:Uncharacterized protein n=2 Tax=Leptospira interrogans TaxID=173 RepID=A0A0M4N7M2_LEPIR|nr:hypothetical protein G436_1497 [Leptospira interrogans serovar Hardjo str. Norma]ALN99950.1 hypothetical protein LIH_06235 [Leptospira interrogans serovar Hardjo-prajitno]OOB95422.1 hypothetical protein B0191_07910 [Leptospira interrogans serovar Hardjo]QEH99440.1 hypothetical protein FWJ33_08365 [Leptospira interrogans serovar Hardjo]